MQKRVYGIDLLRVISMLMIVTLHVLLHGGILDAALPGTVNYGAAWFLETAAYCGVNCYALISGYVGVGARYRYSNILYLWLQVSGINVLVTVIFSLVKPDAVGKWGMLRAAFPVLTDAYWYFTAYFAMFFFLPFLNYLVQTLKQKQLESLLFAAFMLFSVMPTIVDEDIFRISNGYSASWLILLYLTGAYIRRYGKQEKKHGGIYLLLYLICVLVCWSSKLGIEYIDELRGLNFNNEWLLKYNSPFILFAAICLLMCFRNLKISRRLGNFIWKISALTFGVYLWHDNPLIRENILSDKLTWVAEIPLPAMIGTVFGVTAFIFAVCCCVDFVRKTGFERLGIRRMCEGIEKGIGQCLYNLSERNKK